MSEDLLDAQVHLIGWTGAQARHVEKYAEMWRSMPGAPATVVEISHCRMGVSEPWNTARFESLAAELLERLAAESGKKIVLHIFSNGGGTLWAAAARLIQATSLRVRLSGLIFDSCPGSMRSIRTGFNFLWESQRSPAIRGALVACSPVLVLAFAAMWAASIRCAGGQVTDVQSRYVHDLMLYAKHHGSRPPRLPVLFLYSANDALIRPDAVEAVMRMHEESGVCDVMSKRWECSPHVRHLETDREGYTAACKQVLSKL